MWFIFSAPSEPEDVYEIVMNFTALIVLVELDNMIVPIRYKADFELNHDDIQIYLKFYAEKKMYEKENNLICSNLFVFVL